MSYIRKISVGADYKNAMHYIVGQQVMRGEYEISEIVQYEDGYGVIVRKDKICTEWKKFVGIPIVIEYNMDMI